MNADHLGIVEGEPSGVATILVESSTGQNKIVIVQGSEKKMWSHNPFLLF